MENSVKTIYAPISKVKLNPNNPRTIKDDKFKKLVASIKEFPKMLDIRPIVVNADMIVLGGNMRLQACKEAGLKKVPIIKADNLTPEEQKQFIIKDNISGGEWDWAMLAEWDNDELESWGLDVPAVKEEREVKDLSDNVETTFRIEVIATDERDQERIYNQLKELGLECRILTL